MKCQNLAHSVETPPQKGEVSFEQWAFKVRIVMQSHMEVTLREGIVQSLHGAMANLA